MNNFNDKLNINWRAGYRVDIVTILDDMEDKYSQFLKNTVECFDDYDSISNETFSDFSSLASQFELMKKLGYLDEDECDELINCAEEMRFDILENLEKEGEKDGSKEE